MRARTPRSFYIFAIFVTFVLFGNALTGWSCSGQLSTNEAINEPSKAAEPRQPDASQLEPSPEPAPPEKVAEKPNEACELVLPGPLSVHQGSRLSFESTTNPPSATVEIFRHPEDWVTWIDKSTITLRTGYKETGKVAVVFQVTCGDKVTRQSVEVEVKALRWSARNWTPGTGGPSEREHPRLWIHDKHPDTLWLLGGLGFVPRQFTPVYDLWKFDLTNDTWTQVPIGDNAPEVTTPQVAALPGTQKVRVYSGRLASNFASDQIYELDVSGDKGVWSSASEDKWPAHAASLAGFVFDPFNQRFLMIMGAGQDIFRKVSAFDPSKAPGERWQALETGTPQPGGRYGFAYGVDKEQKRLVVFSGGQPGATNQNPVNPASDTWALDLSSPQSTWKKLAVTGNRVPGQRNSCWAMDTDQNRLFVFSGTPDARTAIRAIYALHLDAKEARWHLVSDDAKIPFRSSCTGIYDSKRKRLLFGFGNIIGAIYADFQVLELAP